MPLVIPPGYTDVAIELRATGDPDPWYVTFGLDTSEATGDPTSIGVAANEAWAHPLTQMSNEITHTGCKLTIGQDGAEPVRAFVSAGAGDNGGSSAAMLPQNCALLVRKETAVGGRRAKGRFFVPGILVEGSVDNVGRILTSPLATMQNAFNAMWNALDAGLGFSLPMVLLHNSDGISPIIDPTVVTRLQLDNVVSTQRRRLR